MLSTTESMYGTSFFFFFLFLILLLSAFKLGILKLEKGSCLIFQVESAPSNL